MATHDNTAFPWLDTARYPWQGRHFDCGGACMHYVDVGAGPQTLLFVHGTPTWSLDWADLVRQYAPTHRCIAVDHVGFGLSDKPRDYPYGTARHADNLARLMAALDLRDVTLVVHDFGGPIGIAAALAEPGRVRRLVVFNSWCWSSKGDADYEKFARVLRSPLLPFLYRWLNFSPRFLLRAGYRDKSQLPKGLHRQYILPFQRRAEREGPLAFARSLLQDQDWFQALWARRAELGLKGEDVQVIWGMADTFIGPQHMARWEAAFPGARVQRLEGVGHFVMGEGAGKYRLLF